MEEKLRRTGGNTGNLLFISALHNVIVHKKGQDFEKFNAAQVRERHDGIIVPAANWLNYYSDWGGLASRIEETGLPCVIVGLGAQSHSLSTFPKLTPGTLRLIKVIAERSASLSVRGSYSASTLEHYGIKNVSVTGCPSLLWHTRPVVVSKWAKVPVAIAVGSTRSDLFEKVFDPQDAFKVSVLLSRWALASDFPYIAQSELFDMKVAAGEEGLAPAAQHDHADSARHRDFIRRVYGTDDLEFVELYLKRRVKAFFNIESWLDFLSDLDFVVSTRLHGVIAALLAGVPAVLVVHDVRTREMAEQIRIPFIEAEEMARILSMPTPDVHGIYESADIAGFNANQPAYFGTFRGFFESNDVAVNLPTDALG
jgi:hypothetical protein